MALIAVKRGQIDNGNETAWPKSVYATEYFWKAVADVQKRLLDPKDGVSDAIIAAVIMFAWQDVSEPYLLFSL
jgi:hypothetical protein